MRAYGLPALLAILLLAGCGGGGGGDAGPSPTITVDRKELSFVSDFGGDLPSGQDVVVTFGNGGAGAAVGFAPGVVQPAWLGISAVGSTPNTVTFRFSIVSKAPSGDDVQEVPVRLLTAAVDRDGDVIESSIRYVDIVVKLTINGSLELEREAMSLAGTYPANVGKEVAVYSRRNWSAVSDQPWLEISSNHEPGSYTMTVRARASAAPPGTHNGTVTITDVAGNVRVLAVEYRQTMPGLVPGVATDLELGAINGTPVAGGSRGFSVPGADSSSATMTVATPASWFKPTVSGSGMRYAIDASALNSGVHKSTYTVRMTFDAAHVVERSFPVKLTLTRPTLALPSEIVLDAAGPGSASYDFEVRSDTGVNGLPVTVTPLDAWLPAPTAVSPSISGSSGSIAGKVDAAGLTVGRHDSGLRLTVRANGDVFTHTVPVRLHHASWRLTAGLKAASLVRMANISRSTQIVAVGDTADVPMQFKAASDQPWLTARVSGPTPGKVTLEADHTGLAAGFHEATVTLTPNSAGADPAVETIRVGFYVDTATTYRARNLALSGFAAAMATDPLRPLIYVAENNGTRINAYHQYTHQFVSGFDTPLLANELMVSKDGRELYVKSDLRMVVHSLPDYAFLRELPLGPLFEAPGGTERATMAYARAYGHPLLLSARGGVMDALTGQVLVTPSEAGGPYWADSNAHPGVDVSGDSRRAAVGRRVYRIIYREHDGSAKLQLDSTFFRLMPVGDMALDQTGDYLLALGALFPNSFDLYYPDDFIPNRHTDTDLSCGEVRNTDQVEFTADGHAVAVCKRQMVTGGTSGEYGDKYLYYYYDETTPASVRLMHVTGDAIQAVILGDSSLVFRPLHHPGCTAPRFPNDDFPPCKYM